MQRCGCQPMTGWYRDGFCRTDADDLGQHTVCCQVSESFLSYSKAQGNDLSTPMPQFDFPGLQPGDHWCVCAARWLQAYADGRNAAPRSSVGGPPRSNARSSTGGPSKGECEGADTLPSQTPPGERARTDVCTWGARRDRGQDRAGAHCPPGTWQFAASEICWPADRPIRSPLGLHQEACPAGRCLLGRCTRSRVRWTRWAG